MKPKEEKKLFSGNPTAINPQIMYSKYEVCMLIIDAMRFTLDCIQIGDGKLDPNEFYKLNNLD